MFTLLIATTNFDKIREITEVLKPFYLKLKSLRDYPEFESITVEETGDTFAENALIKARTWGRLTGLVTLADDSGLSVDSLNGRPGVLSARYAPTDPEKISKLLGELAKVTDRAAHFTCALNLFDPSSEKSYELEGIVNGEIALEVTGKKGFGYDPIFYYPPLEKTFGELYPEEKNKVSHRGLALQKLLPLIKKHYAK